MQHHRVHGFRGVYPCYHAIPESKEDTRLKNFLVLKGNCIPVDGVPEIITVLPLGHVVSSKGEFEADEESFRTIQDGITKRGVVVEVGYGLAAPATGS